VGMMGVLSGDVGVTHGFDAVGDTVLLAGSATPRLDGSELLGTASGRPPAPDVPAQVALCAALVEAAERGLLRSAHDVSSGGLAVALAESALGGGLGAEVALPAGRRSDETMFGEGGGRALVTCRPDDRRPLAELFASHGVPLESIGAVAGEAVGVDLDGERVAIGLHEAADAYEGGLAEALR